MPAEKGMLKYFGQPQGLIGALAGRIMAMNRMNYDRNLWAVIILDPRPGDRVLEVGFGPGLGLELFAGLVGKGVVCGLDQSPQMLGQATRRNKRAVEQGRVRLFQAPVDDLPDFGCKFNKVLAVNSYQFWDNGVEGLRGLRGCMDSGGIIALLAQPMLTDESQTEAGRFIEDCSADLAAAGFGSVRVHEKRHKAPFRRVRDRRQ